MMHRAVRERWDHGEPALGGAVLCAPLSLAPMAAAGYDWLWMDCQHGPYDEADAAAILRTLADAPYAMAVRVSQTDSALIGRLLDAGADAVIVPLVESAEQAARAVAACRYPPNGVRSFGPGRPDLGWDLADLEERAGCFVMVESTTAVADIDAIASTPGLTGIVVGPIDLGITMGIAPGDAAGSEQLLGVLAEIVAACRRAGIVPGVLPAGTQHAQRCVEIGYTFVGVGADVLALRVESEREVRLVRETGLKRS
jgi:2-keto-3-deoxy-L-rhamnonate aldolase RhmA